MIDYEKLGAFYLGREYDIDQQQIEETNVLYDSKDLTTHGVIVGMTGSGKTGLGITLLEEAAIDGIPSIIIDPKGDMGNLLLNFPNLSPSDFLPWVHQDDATRKGMSIEEFAADRATLWKKGLAEWNQTPERIQRLRDAADVAIYTPGSDAGLPITILKSLDAPPREVVESSDAMRERVSTAVSGLLTLLGIDADPLRSREHILLSNILDTAWREGRNLDMPSLIREIQQPPFTKIGIMDLETIFSASDRMKLAMTVNNILASPSFANWMQGEPLNIQKLLYTAEGKPRLSVLSISHLNDQERMFFVTLLLNEVVAWMRTQQGTSSLRALLYMDEVFGYLPPVANPPSKLPLLTLLKQARAFGLGLVLSTQNPVDLDYKALSNAGTWFLGRLQTERDKLRVLDGLEGASAEAGTQFDRKRIEAILSGVGSRVFLMNNVHEDRPAIFQTRWALSYLGGPLTRDQISTLMAERQQSTPPESGKTHATTTPLSDEQSETFKRHLREPIIIPVLPNDTPQKYVAVSRSTPRDAQLIYRPALFAEGALHYVDSKSDIDEWKQICLYRNISDVDDLGRDPWDEADEIGLDDLDLLNEPEPNIHFHDLPSDCNKKSSWRSWNSSFKTFLYREQRLTLSFSPDLKEYSRVQEREGDFLARIRQAAREKRDLEIARLRKKYESKFRTLQDRVRKAEARVSEEKEQANSATMSAVVSIGSTILGALFGRKTMSATNISKAGTSMRSATRAVDQRSDIQRAEAEVEALKEDLTNLEQELKQGVDLITEEFSDGQLKLESYEIKPRKSDVTVDQLCLIWLPYQVLEDSSTAIAAFQE